MQAVILVFLSDESHQDVALTRPRRGRPRVTNPLSLNERQKAHRARQGRDPAQKRLELPNR